MNKVKFHHHLGVIAVALAVLVFAVVYTETQVSANALTESHKSQNQNNKLNAKSASPLMAAPLAAMQGTVVVVKVLVVNGNDIYVGGTFSAIGGIAANNIARYNLVSQKWFALGADNQVNGNGVRGGSVSAISILGNDIYVAGTFTGADNRLNQFVSANNVARWNTTSSTWSALGSGVGEEKNGVNGEVNSSVVANGKIYFAGKFKKAYNSASTSLDAFNVASWDPNSATWSPLAKGLGAITTKEVLDMEVMGDNLYIGGDFGAVFRADNSVVHVACIARWNFTTNNWFALGVESDNANTNGAGGDVYALETDGTTLYVGGFFPFVKNSFTDKPPASNIARWNGTTWSTLNGATNVNNNGTDQTVREICYNGGMLYIAGEFENVKNANGSLMFASYLARWNGSAWTIFGGAAAEAGNGVNNEVLALAIASGQVYVGGIFTEAYNNVGSMLSVDGLARWTGSVWTSVAASAIKALATVSAASYFSSSEASVESIVAAFGTTLATGTKVGNTIPLGTNLLNTTVNVRDAAGTTRSAPLFFVSAAQINFLVPAGTSTGVATVTVNSGDGSQSQGTLNIVAYAPGMFTFNANGNGVPAAQLLRVKANGAISYESLASYDNANSRWVPAQIDLGPAGEKVFLIAYGTAIRGRGNTTATMKIGGTDAAVSYAAAQGGLTGVDQVNAEIPRSLIGRGDANVVFSVGAKNANTVLINIK